jgi:alpha,alpha-trehalase
MELDIAFLARVAGDHAAERHYTKAANARRLAINSILWNEEMGQWFDYWLPLNDSEVQSVDMQKAVYDFGSGRLNLESYASNFVPLWCGMLPPGDAKGDKVLRALSNSGLLHPGGIATSVRETGQQWFVPVLNILNDYIPGKERNSFEVSHRQKKFNPMPEKNE